MKQMRLLLAPGNLEMPGGESVACAGATGAAIGKSLREIARVAVARVAWGRPSRVNVTSTGVNVTCVEAAPRFMRVV